MGAGSSHSRTSLLMAGLAGRGPNPAFPVPPGQAYLSQNYLLVSAPAPWLSWSGVSPVTQSGRGKVGGTGGRGLRPGWEEPS